MNIPDEHTIELLLRKSPRPIPPRDLKEQLLANTRDAGKEDSRTFGFVIARGGWLRRWWIALAPAGISLLCCVVLAVQQREIRNLKQAIQSISARVAASQTALKTIPRPLDKSSPADSALEEQQEITHLKALAAQTSAEISELKKMRSENEDLRAQLTAPPDHFSPEEMAEIEKAREKVFKISCINNLKQIGLACRIWAGDYSDIFPPDIVLASNELSTTKILVCGADTGRQAAADFGSFTPANCSYQFFLNPPVSDLDPARVVALCPIHGNVLLADGSVQALGTNYSALLIRRDGKLYFQPPQNSFPTP